MTAEPEDPRKKLVEELEASFAPVRKQASEAYRQAAGLVHAFAEQVDKTIRTTGRVSAKVTVELGHLVNAGQEHRVVIRANKIGLVDHLLRAFIPADGYPVTLDAFEETDLRCETADELVKNLVLVSQEPAMRQRLAAIRSALADQSLQSEHTRVAKAAHPAKSAPKATGRTKKSPP